MDNTAVGGCFKWGSTSANDCLVWIPRLIIISEKTAITVMQRATFRIRNRVHCFSSILIDFMSIKHQKSKNEISCLAFYYFCFLIWIQFPAAHSLLDDLYQGKIRSLVILGGIHNHPADTPFAIFDNHSTTVLSVDTCLICTTYTSGYTAVLINEGILLHSKPGEIRPNQDSKPAKPAKFFYYLRAPPAELS